MRWRMAASLFSLLVLASLVISEASPRPPCLGNQLLYPYGDQTCVYIEVLQKSFWTHQKAVEACSMRDLGSLGWFPGGLPEIEEPKFKIMLEEWMQRTGAKLGASITFWVGLIRDEAKDATEIADREKWLDGSKWRWNSGISLRESMAKGVSVEWSNTDDMRSVDRRCAFASVNTSHPTSVLLRDHECNTSGNPHIDHIICHLNMGTKISPMAMVSPPWNPAAKHPHLTNTTPKIEKAIEWKSALIGAAIAIVVVIILAVIGFVVIRRRYQSKAAAAKPVQKLHSPESSCTSQCSDSMSGSINDGEKRMEDYLEDEEHSYENIVRKGKKKDKKDSSINKSLLVDKKNTSAILAAKVG